MGRRTPWRICLVSIHAPAWGGTRVCRYQALITVVAVTLPSGERPIFLLKSRFERMFQSTLPRGERRSNHFISPAFCSVSIHAPAWGATIMRIWQSVLILVSIHAPAWGATALNYRRSCKLIVSIHAPAWGATGMNIFLLKIHRVSIHAPAWGATALLSIGLLSAFKHFFPLTNKCKAQF